MIRYPGSKDKIADQILRNFPDSARLPLFQGARMEYREPFFGAGAVGLRLMKHLRTSCRVWLNDKDFAMASLWKAILDQPDELIEEVRKYVPSVDDFYRFRDEDGDGVVRDVVIVALRKLVLHQISFSGLGAMAGGPLGGRGQRSEYNVDCRWNSARLCLEIKRHHDLLSRFPAEITSGDFEKVISGAPRHAVIYADPPYYLAGPQLYKHSMSDDDHRRLANALRQCDAHWVLSYDDHPFIRDLYEGWASVGSVALTYTNAVADGPRRKNSELIINRLHDVG